MENRPVYCIDLFSGVGGFSLGAERAGFCVKCAIDNNPIALATHAINFPNSIHLNEDIREIKGKALLRRLDIKPEDIFGIVGGPPCQGFSDIGKQSISDNRNELFYHFFRIIREMQPSFFIAENVPGILSSKFDYIRDLAFQQVKRKYTLLNPIKASAMDYGAPTSRKRVIFIGYQKSYFSEFKEDVFFPNLAEAKMVVVKDALYGLPSKVDSNGAPYWTIIKPLPKSDFGMKTQGVIPSRVGDSIAVKRLIKNYETTGHIGTLHSPDISKRYGALLFGQRDAISKSVRLDPEGLCPTLRAGTGKERGSFQAVRPIHPYEPRVITPREAARLQGFPDWFVFHNTKWHSFMQIGNSISPMVSEYFLMKLFDLLNARAQHDESLDNVCKNQYNFATLY